MIGCIEKMPMYLDTEEKQKMSTNEKLQKLPFPSSQCAPMSELVTGGEIFDALSVLADNPEYLAEILDGRDGVDSPCVGGSWGGPPAVRTRPASGEDKGGGGRRCGCGGGGPVVDGGRGGEMVGVTGGMNGYSSFKTERCDDGLVGMSCGGLSRGVDYPLNNLGLTTSCNNGHTQTSMNHHHHQQHHPHHLHHPHHDNINSHHQQHHHNNNNNNHLHNPPHTGTSLPPPPLTLPTTNPSPPTSTSSWADPGGLGGGLGEAAPDHSFLLYRADLYYSGSESGGDTTGSSSCSPGYDPASIPPMDFTLSTLDVHSLKDMTLSLKQEPLSTTTTASPSLDPCAYTLYNNNNNLDINSKAHLTHCPPPALEEDGVGLEEVQGAAPADLAPYPDSPQDGSSGLEDADVGGLLSDSLLSDGEGSNVGGCQSKIKGMKPDRRLRRREQNRQAARRCRQRKKEQSQELVKEYYQLLSANSEMQSKLKILESEKQRLNDIYEAHLATCTVHLVNTANCK